MRAPIHLMPNLKATADQAVAEWQSLYEQYGNAEYGIGEEITQKEHVLQAAYFARIAGAPPEVVAALLFHDVGQFVDVVDGNIQHLESDRMGKDVGTDNHLERGRRYLRSRGFPKSVVDFVYNHAMAKIVLAENDPVYQNNLTNASKISLEWQKGIFADALTAFRARPDINNFKAFRKCDDMGKQLRMKILPKEKALDWEKGNFGYVPDIDAYRDVIDMAFGVRDKSTYTINPDWQNNIHRLFLLHLNCHRKDAIAGSPSSSGAFCKLIGIESDKTTGHDNFDIELQAVEFVIANNPAWLKHTVNLVSPIPVIGGYLSGVLAYMYPDNLTTPGKFLQRTWANQTPPAIVPSDYLTATSATQAAVATVSTSRP